MIFVSLRGKVAWAFGIGMHSILTSWLSRAGVYSQHTLFFFYRTFKAKYFPSSNFLAAKVGFNPSLIWRSFLAARDLLKIGMEWKVGNGQSIHIW